ncbi:VPS10 domain-containing protein [Actinomadura rudentiformis]|uniref:Glycosyl hydrolase n=1 Tax=Actinomadura rudentiformis TaxID=359158 RepID=A0A6H9YZA4_9ACTN|nr:glycosyl hydrolase [Actinomadura rudentiformis]KAB2349614.1 glycosyl hydrolase [Actinomadura rudentiformis]
MPFPSRSPVRRAALALGLTAVLTSSTLAAPTAAQADRVPPRLGPAAPGEFKALQDTSGGLGLPERALIQAGAAARQKPGIGVRWRSEGPDNIGGRVTGIAVDPRRADTVYVAAASGGMWKSTDRGRTLTAIWPESYPQAIGAVATSSDGAIYVGTGESNPGGGSITYEGDGIYKSTDGGRTWKNIGLRRSATISLIAVDPANPKRIYVAATGSLFRPGGERGVYVSSNGGRSWTRSLDVPNATTGASGLAIDPANPKRLFATLWDRRREPDLRRYGGVGSGLYRSLDGGASWTRLDNVTAPTPGDDIALRSDPRLGRIGVGIAPSRPDRVYVLTSTYGQFGNHKGFYVSDDGGDSFATAALPPGNVPYWWTGYVWIDPADPERVLIPSASLFESTNGGKSWTSNEGMHVDHHAIAWDPKVPGRVYEGNDGGVYRSDANGRSGTWQMAVNHPFTQFYTLTVSAQDATRIAGGTQDNGSLRTWGGPRWNEFQGGDGEANVIDPADQNIVYSCYQFGFCSRSTDGGDTLVPFRGLAEEDRYNWLSPVVLQPGATGTVYFGSNRLYRSTNGLDYTPVSPDLTGGPGRDEVYPFGTLTTIAPSATDPRSILVGSDDGRVSATTDGGQSWRLLLKDQPWVTRVAVDPRNARRAFATLSGYRAQGTGGHVLLTTDGGANWRDVTGTLPEAPVNDIVIGPAGILFVATDVGVYAGAPSGRFWLRLGHLPLAPVNDIEFNAVSGRLFAATFGRGIYSTQITPAMQARLQRGR